MDRLQISGPYQKGSQILHIKIVNTEYDPHYTEGPKKVIYTSTSRHWSQVRPKPIKCVFPVTPLYLENDSNPEFFYWPMISFINFKLNRLFLFLKFDF